MHLESVNDQRAIMIIIYDSEQGFAFHHDYYDVLQTNEHFQLFHVKEVRKRAESRVNSLLNRIPNDFRSIVPTNFLFSQGKCRRKFNINSKRTSRTISPRFT